MRRYFTGHFPLEVSQRDAIWAEGTLVVDTNVLLNLYRVQPATRDSVLAAMEAFGDRIWIPYQVAAEFHANRVRVIREQQQLIPSVLVRLEEIRNVVSSQLNAHTRNPLIDVAAVRDRIDAAISTSEEIVREQQDDALAAYAISPQRDSVLIKLGEIFDSRVGKPFEKGRLDRLAGEGDRRISSQIPPGYLDSKKKDMARYGDFFVWQQILDEFTHDRRDMILVTDDDKEDWWLRCRGESLGGRPELFQEFYEATEQRMLMFKTAHFLKDAQEREVATVAPNSVDDANELSAWDNQDQFALDLLEGEVQTAAVSKTIRRIDANIATIQEKLNRNRENLKTKDVVAPVLIRLAEIERDEQEMLRSAIHADSDNDRAFFIEQAERLAERRRPLETAVGKTVPVEEIESNNNDHLTLVAQLATLRSERNAHVSDLREMLEVLDSRKI